MSDHAHAHHRNYVKIWAILLGLLVISVIGPMTGIRVVMLLTAFGVALVKAYLVAKNFMHLDVEKPIVHWMLAIALAFMVLLFAGVSPDVMKDRGDRWKKDENFHYERTHHPGAHGAATHGGSGAEHGVTTPADGGASAPPGEGAGGETPPTDGQGGSGTTGGPH